MLFLEGKVEQKVITHLKLNDEETKWLRGFIQNPLTDNEPPSDAKMRCDLWEILNRTEHNLPV